MPEKDENTQLYYQKLFTEDPLWSTPFPNPDEAARWAKICIFLSQIPGLQQLHRTQRRLRILDVGCGRGWLTRMASIYGHCDGVDPAASPIELAREYFPDLNFYQGTMDTILQSSDFKPYDVVISSEVIEHVDAKSNFVTNISKCLVSNGHAIITTPRGEEYHKYIRSGYDKQPVEEWISESALQELFQRHGFMAVKHDRAYLDLPKASFLHKLAADARFARLLDKLYLIWLHKGLQYLTGIYQVWCFQLK